MHCGISFVKDENSSLTSMASTLYYIVDYHPLKFQQVDEGSYFGHFMSKTC
jgi:hypothetical protein